VSGGESSSPITIVIADDHSVAREGLISMLSRQPDFVVVGEASNGQEALDLCDSLRPDILLLDLRMPILDGFQTVEALRRRKHPVRVVVMTTHDGEEDVRRVLKAGVKGYLLKDAMRQEVWETVRKVHAGESALSPSVIKSVTDAMSNPTLTDREQKVLTLLASGLSNRKIAEKLCMGESTVKTHMNSLMLKLNAKSRTEAVVVASRRGLTRIAD
jgi:DNA-binding NarL/FixJ family response regulator